MNFDNIYKIMQDSFPETEICSYENQKKLLDNPNYNIRTYEKDGQVLGFIAYNRLGEFYFVEHLACQKEARGKGIGSKLLIDILGEARSKPILLEVEVPENEEQKSRIKFYEKLGFFFNDFYHFQPPINEGTSGIELRIMSSLHPLNQREHKRYRRLINLNIYNVDPNFEIG